MIGRGAVIQLERLAGEPISEVFQSRILDKVGMTQSTFPAITDALIPDPHPQGYTFGTNVGTIDSLVLSPEIQAGAADGTLEPIDTTDLNPSLLVDGRCGAARGSPAHSQPPLAVGAASFTLAASSPLHKLTL